MRARAEKSRGDWGGSNEKPLFSFFSRPFARVFAASLLSSVPDKTAMLRRLHVNRNLSFPFYMSCATKFVSLAVFTLM